MTSVEVLNHWDPHGRPVVLSEVLRTSLLETGSLYTPVRLCSILAIAWCGGWIGTIRVKIQTPRERYRLPENEHHPESRSQRKPDSGPEARFGGEREVEHYMRDETCMSVVFHHGSS